MDPAALPLGLGQHLFDGPSKPLARVTDDELHAAKAAALEVLQEVAPERFVLHARRREAQHLPASVFSHTDGDEHGHLAHRMVLPHELVASVDEHVAAPRQRPRAELLDLWVQGFEHAAQGALGQTLDAHRLSDGLRSARRDTLLVALHQGGHQRVVRALLQAISPEFRGGPHTADRLGPVASK